jgi:hypothetical protein
MSREHHQGCISSPIMSPWLSSSFGNTMTPPDEYVRYCTGDGPKEGGLSVEPGWFMLWPLAEIEQLNRDYHVQELLPGFLGFGSNGGGELLAFDSRGHVFMVPFLPMEASEAKPVADSWAEFAERIER